MRGFTLLELLVVIAIVGGLSALLVPNFMGARERARDTQRKSDLKQIQTALELHWQTFAPPYYPNSLPFPGECWTEDGGGPDCLQTGGDIVLMRKVPADPNLRDQNGDPAGYFYSQGNGGQSYNLCSCLENVADSEGEQGSCDDSYACSSDRKFALTEP